MSFSFIFIDRVNHLFFSTKQIEYIKHRRLLQRAFEENKTTVFSPILTILTTVGYSGTVQFTVNLET